MAEKKSRAGSAPGKKHQAKKQSRPEKKGTGNNLPQIELPSLEEFLTAGSHFGHRTSLWDPKMKKYIYTERNNVHIIDLIETMKKLHKALEQIQRASNQGRILIVGTKGQAAGVVKNVARKVGAYYIDSRWPGGLFTNFDVMKKSLRKLRDMEEEIAMQPEDLVKKEILSLKRQVRRLNNLYSGVKLMDRLPKLIVVIDSKVEKNAIREANKVGIPVVALVDTNCNPELVDWPIPANDDSIKSIKLFVDLFGRAIKGGKQANALITLRTDYEKRIEQIAREREQEIARRKAMEEAEQKRIQALKDGKEVKAEVGGGKVVGVKKKAEVEADKKVTEKEASKKSKVKKVKAKKKEVKKERKETKKSEKKSDKINLNEADVKEFKNIGGVGDALAKRIVKNRPFRKVEELKEVKGIGDKMYDDMKGKIEV